MTILYADDDKDDSELFIEVLTKVNPDVKCVCAANGEQALNILRSKVVHADYVFLDINMPIMDGKRCLRELKSDSALRNIPVVIYSTTNDLYQINELFSLGAASYIQKPTNVSSLHSILKSFLNKSDQHI